LKTFLKHKGNPILKPNGHLYQFRISATNDVNYGQPNILYSHVSDPVRTKLSPPIHQPINFTATPITSSRIHLVWYEQLDSKDKHNEDFLIKFKLTYRLVLQSQLSLHSAVELELDHHATRQPINHPTYRRHEFLLDGQFLHNGTYELKLCGINQIGIGKCSNTQSLVYMEDTLPITLIKRPNVTQPRSYQLLTGIETLSSTELNVTWSQPNEQLINGKLYAYKIVYFINETPDNFEQFLANFLVPNKSKSKVKPSLIKFFF